MGWDYLGSWVVIRVGDVSVNLNGGSGDGENGMDLEDVEMIEFIWVGDKLDKNREVEEGKWFLVWVK